MSNIKKSFNDNTFMNKKIRNKAQELLLKWNHPTLLNNAQHFFHNQNGTTIIKEKVSLPEGISNPINSFFLENKDYEYIIRETINNIDPILKEYDLKVAIEDSLSRIIASALNGRFAGKIDSNTYNCLLTVIMKKIQKE
jgi:hypothetical protein